MNKQNPLYTSVNSQCHLAVKNIADRILRAGKMSRQDHIMLTSTILADGKVSNEDRRHINRIFDHIQTGRLKLIDW
jgi:hypothetical protein